MMIMIKIHWHYAVYAICCEHDNDDKGDDYDGVDDADDDGQVQVISGDSV